MAGDWIKMRTALAHDPAVIAIALDLDKNEFEVVGMLHHIWSWADSQSQDGHIKRVTEKWLDRFVHCDGFAKSMEMAKWLVIKADGIEFPNFGKHNGESAKKRAEAAERKRISRESSGKTAKENVPNVSHKTCDESVTREEKRREENKDQDLLSPAGPDDVLRSPKISYSLIQDAYNRTCGHVLPKCIAMTEKRKTKVRSMGSLEINGSKPFKDLGVDFWVAYFNDALQNPWNTGSNDRGWRADFDYLVNPSNALKILEKTNGA